MTTHPLHHFFLKNAGNRVHPNRLSFVLMNPHGKQASVVFKLIVGDSLDAGMATVPPTASTSMIKRDQKSVLNKFLNSATTPMAKRAVAKVHTKTANRDAAMTVVIQCYDDELSSQEITLTRIELKHAMG
jgi:hypothetical protein